MNDETYNKIERILIDNNITINDLLMFIRHYWSIIPTHTRKISLAKTKIDEAFLWFNSSIE